AVRCRRTTAGAAGRARAPRAPRGSSSPAGRPPWCPSGRAPTAAPTWRGDRGWRARGCPSGRGAGRRGGPPGPRRRARRARRARQGVEVAGVARVLVALPLVAPDHERAVAPVEVEVLVLLVGGAIQRPQPEGRADAVAVAAPVERRQAPDTPRLLAEPALAED